MTPWRITAAVLVAFACVLSFYQQGGITVGGVVLSLLGIAAFVAVSTALLMFVSWLLSGRNK